MNRHIACALLAMASLVLLSACGESEGSEGPVDVNLDEGTVAACLEEGGATFAESRAEVKLYAKAATAEEVEGGGYVFDDEVAKLAVSVWSEETPSGGLPKWIVWIGQPYLQSRSIEEIVERDPPRAYVAYVKDPSPSSREKLEACADSA